MHAIHPRALAGAGASAQNIVVNGGFESNVLAASSFATFASIAGWTVDSQIELRRDRIGTAIEGNNFAELDAENNKNNTISQTLATEVGATYSLTFFYSNRPFKSVGDPDNVNKSSSGLDFAIGSLTGSAPEQPTITDGMIHWNSYTTSFVATSTSTLLSFTGTGTVDNFGSALDNISVTMTSPVPEPASYALLLAGLGAVGLFARRRH